MHYFSVLQSLNTVTVSTLTYKSILRIASLAMFISGMRLTCCYHQLQFKNKSVGCLVFFSPPIEKIKGFN